MITIKEAANEYAERRANPIYRRLEVSISSAAFIDGAEFVQRWIPVEECIPPEDPEEPGWSIEVIGKCMLGYHEVYQYSFDDKLFHRSNIDRACEITHWRLIDFK